MELGEIQITDSPGLITKVKKHLLPVLLGLVVLNAVLTACGLVPAYFMRYFLYLAAGVEFAFFMMLILRITRVVRKYRQLKNEGLDSFVSLQSALVLAVPATAAKWVVLELRLYHTLLKSLTSRTDLSKEGFFSNRLENYSFFFKIIIGLCIVEIGVVYLVLPDSWSTWKIVHFVIGVWAIIFLTADYNGMKVYVNELSQSGIRLQMGLRCCRDIAWEEIAGVNKVSKTGSTFSFGPEAPGDEPGTLYLSAGETCNVAIDFRQPQIIPGMIKDFTKISRVYLSLDQPDDFFEEVNKRQIRTE